MMLTTLHETAFKFMYGREIRDVEKELVKRMVELETADWPEGAYLITSDTSEACIQYNGISIFEHMKTVREKNGRV